MNKAKSSIRNFNLLTIVTVYLACMIFGSIARVDSVDYYGNVNDKCSNVYLIDYILYTKWFCEVSIEEDKDSE